MLVLTALKPSACRLLPHWRCYPPAGGIEADGLTGRSVETKLGFGNQHFDLELVSQ